MKKILCLALILSLLMIPLSNSAGAEAPALTIAAPSAILMEKETGTVLFEKNADEPGFPASVTKIMTLLLIMEAIDNGVFTPDDTVTASERAASFGGSCVYLEAGERMRVRDMLKCIAVVSANDCAVAMAEFLCGSEEAFVKKMNDRAKELELKHTHFSNCTGLFDDGQHYTTARDVAIMSRELIRHEAIKEYTTIWMDSIRDGSFDLANTNKLVYWYPGCTGLKTGYTSTARYCLSATAERSGVEYIAVVMHGETADSRNRDAETLLSYGFANYRLIPLSDSAPLPLLPVELGEKKSVPLALDGPAYQVAEKGGEADYRLTLRSSVPAPVKKGQPLGSLRVTVGEKTIAEVPVCAAEDVPRIGVIGIFKKLALSLFGI